MTTTTTIQSREAITNYLDMHRRFEGMTGHPMLETWLLDHGTFYDGKALPDGWDYGRAKECFTNAFHQVFGDDGGRYRYCEGYAYTPGLIPCHHAWIVDTEDGMAIDVTWRDGGRVCGFCLGSGTETDDDEESDTYGDESDCGWCHGTGEQDHDHPAREGTAYFGVEMDRDWVVRTVVDQGYYGVLARYAAEHDA